MSIISSYSCKRTIEEDYPWAEHTYYLGIGSVDEVSGNGLEYFVNKNDLLEIPVYFKSSYSRPYSPEVYYYVSSVSGDNVSLVCGKDYVLLNAEGQILASEQNGGYSMIWKNAENGVQNIYIKILSDIIGSIRVSILNHENSANSNLILRTEDYEIRAYPGNYYVTVNINNDIDETENSYENENILASWNFEDDEPLHDLHFENIKNDGSIIVEDPQNSNNKVMYVELPSGLDRREVMWADGNNNYYMYPNTKDIKHGDEFWIGLKVYVPKIINSQQSNSPSIFQIGPISSRVNFQGSVGLYQLQAPSHYSFFRWRKFKYEYSPIGDINEVKMSDLRYNQWENFVIHCILRDNDEEGLVEIWKNGVKVYSLKQANAINDTRVVIKWGVYIGVGNSSKDVLSCYYDDIKIGNALSGYDAVAPK